jgi:hypothetical protein
MFAYDHWVLVTPNMHSLHHSSHQPETDIRGGRLFVHDGAIRVRQLPKEVVDVLIVGECWRDREKKDEKRFFI